MDGYKQEVKGFLVHQRPTGSDAECLIKAALSPAPPPAASHFKFGLGAPRRDVTVRLGP